MLTTAAAAVSALASRVCASTFGCRRFDRCLYGVARLAGLVGLTVLSVLAVLAITL
jgi:hypothetical protein